MKRSGADNLDEPNSKFVKLLDNAFSSENDSSIRAANFCAAITAAKQMESPSSSRQSFGSILPSKVILPGDPTTDLSKNVEVCKHKTRNPDVKEILCTKNDVAWICSDKKMSNRSHASFSVIEGGAMNVIGDSSFTGFLDFGKKVGSKVHSTLVNNPFRGGEMKDEDQAFQNRKDPGGYITRVNQIFNSFPCKRIRFLFISHPDMDHLCLYKPLLFEEHSWNLKNNVSVDSLIMSGDPGLYAKHNSFLIFLAHLIEKCPFIDVFFTIFNCSLTKKLKKKNAEDIKKIFESWSFIPLDTGFIPSVTFESPEYLVPEFSYDSVTKNYKFINSSESFVPAWEGFLMTDNVNCLILRGNIDCEFDSNQELVCYTSTNNEQSAVVEVSLSNFNVLLLGDSPVKTQQKVAHLNRKYDAVVLSHDARLKDLDTGLFSNSGFKIIIMGGQWHVTPIDFLIQFLLKNCLALASTSDPIELKAFSFEKKVDFRSLKTCTLMKRIPVKDKSMEELTIQTNNMIFNVFQNPVHFNACKNFLEVKQMQSKTISSD